MKLLVCASQDQPMRTFNVHKMEEYDCPVSSADQNTESRLPYRAPRRDASGDTLRPRPLAIPLRPSAQIALASPAPTFSATGPGAVAVAGPDRHVWIWVVFDGDSRTLQGAEERWRWALCAQKDWEAKPPRYIYSVIAVSLRRLRTSYTMQATRVISHSLLAVILAILSLAHALENGKQ
jgi:hypothetical protein